MYIFTTNTHSTLFWLFFGGLCYYLALPPVNVAPLALLVPICWGMVILGVRSQESGDRRQEQKETGCTATGSAAVCRLPSAVYSLPSAVFITAYLFWLASIYWVSHPYPPFTTIGLFILAAALSVFWVLFFVSARVAVHRYKIPLLFAMPLCWIGTEYIRCRILGGFSFCALEHAFYLYPPLIQFASVGGSLLVGGIIMFLGAALCEIFVFFVSFVVKKRNNHKGHKGHKENTKGVKFRAAMATSSVCFVFSILLISMVARDSGNKGTSYSIVALQGNRQVYIDGGQEEADKTFAQFVHLAYQEIHDRKQAGAPLPDLIVFPETVCPIPVLVFEGTITPDDLGWTEEQATYWERDFRQFADHIETPLLLGLSTWFFEDEPEPIRLNSALFVPPSEYFAGETANSKMLRYDKMHLVLFGEYVPFAEYLPKNFILRTLCHEARHGTKPLAIPIGVHRARSVSKEQRIQASVNICFESSVAHLIRKQILMLRKEGHDPRVLINLSNDGWFRDSHAIEQHLATHVFRAVENRMYYVTATNGGFSAIISPYGEIRSIGQRGGAEAVSGEISVNLNVPQRVTFFQIVGDWYALPFAIGVLVLSGIGFGNRRNQTGKQS